MPAHRLTSHPAQDGAPAAGTGITARATVQAVLEVLAGGALTAAAAKAGLDPAELIAAAEIYQQAGRRAIEQHTAGTNWWQLCLQFANWPDSQLVASSELLPLLRSAEDTQAARLWWYIRKHPCWRLRILPGPGGEHLKASITAALEELTAAGRIERWWPGIYEPETAAFGGPHGMQAAHELFHADSRNILDLHNHHETALGHRELSVMLCGIMLSAARLEWYEQGDVWHLVAADRPLPAGIGHAQLDSLGHDLMLLMHANTEPDGPLLGPGGPAAFAAGWADAFRQAGTALGEAGRNGALDRGIRHILAYHVIFHWNRLGLPARTQAILARAASAAILNLTAPNPPAGH